MTRSTSSSGGWELPISEAELAGMTRGMEEAHRETMPAMRERAADLTAHIRQAESSRRKFLLGVGAVGAGLALAACSSGSSSSKSSASPASGASGMPASGGVANSPYTGDLKVVALATALENQAVAAYQAALSAAQAGKLGTVPPAVATFATTAMSQHADHAKAWNAVLTGAGKPAITGIPLSNQPQVEQALGSVTDVGGVATLALGLENQAAQTYLFATYNVTAPQGIATAATIAPVEAMHAAILNFVLGQYPVPDDFLPVDKAANPALLTV